MLLVFLFVYFLQQYQTEGLSSNPKASVDGQVVDITSRFSQPCFKEALHYFTYENQFACYKK